MDVATMVAINNLNMVTVMAVQAANNVITIVNGERMEEDMDGSMLDQYMGKDCTVSLFNEVGAIKGKLMDASFASCVAHTMEEDARMIITGPG